MPYVTDDIECADVQPGNSLEPSAYCQYLIEGQSAYLCEKNTRRPYYILLRAGRGEEIVIFHTERFVDAVTRRAGTPGQKKTDWALIGKYTDENGKECAVVVFLELVSDLSSEGKLEHKKEQCEATVDFFCKNESNDQNLHAHVPDDIYRAFGDFRQHRVYCAIAPQKYNIARGRLAERRLQIYLLDAGLFVDRRTAKAKRSGRGRSVHLERPRAVSFRELVDAMGVKL